MKKFGCILLVVCSITLLNGQTNNFWTNTTNIDNSMSVSNRDDANIEHTFNLNIEGITQALLNAPVRGEATTQSNLILQFPNSKGEMESFRVMEAPVMHPDLQSQYPDIRSYVGVNVLNSSYIRFSISPYNDKSDLHKVDFMIQSGNSLEVFKLFTDQYYLYYNIDGLVQNNTIEVSYANAESNVFAQQIDATTANIYSGVTSLTIRLQGYCGCFYRPY